MVVSVVFITSSFSFGDSGFGFINFLLCDVGISLIGIHGVGSEMNSGSVNPVFVRYIFNASTIVVIVYFHGSQISFVFDGIDFGN